MVELLSIIEFFIIVFSLFLVVEVLVCGILLILCVFIKFSIWDICFVELSFMIAVGIGKV